MTPHENWESERECLLQAIQEYERQGTWVACEIHDGVAQYLTAALLRLETYARGLLAEGDAPGGLDPQFETGLALLRKGIEETRRLINGLRPPVLDELGLVAAIEGLIEEVPLPGGVEFVHQVQFERLPPLLENNLFRIVQEALHNVAKHSQSPSARVELRQDGGTLHLSVSDVGQGFDTESRFAGTHGLSGIRQRARLLGGVARIASRPGEGTRVEVKVKIGDCGLRIADSESPATMPIRNLKSEI